LKVLYEEWALFLLQERLFHLAVNLFKLQAIYLATPKMDGMKVVLAVEVLEERVECLVVDVLLSE
jgi:hypothetical protein